eukprot:6542424-Pyramimonas_sp.AAC.1
MCNNYGYIPKESRGLFRRREVSPADTEYLPLRASGLVSESPHTERLGSLGDTRQGERVKQPRACRKAS